LPDREGITLVSGARRADGDAHSFESAFWTRLLHAQDSAAFAAQWLDIQCRQFDGVLRGVVVLRTSEAGSFAPAAVWPEGVEGNPKLAAALERTLATKDVVVQGAKKGAKRQDTVFLGHPIIVDEQLYGAVALEVEGRNESALGDLVQRLGWGVGWLEALARRKTFTSKARLVTVLELIATALQHERFQAAATAVVTELATTLGCERVSIGFLKERHNVLAALSHSAAYGKKTNLVRALEAAMDEAADQMATVVHPARSDGPFQVTRAHAQLVQEHGAGAACTVPLTAGGKVLGAIVLERPVGESFDARTVELCEQAALLVGPVLETKRRDDRWIGRKIADSGVAQWRRLVGPGHAALKFWVGLAALATLFLAIAEGDYRITANATLEGQVQRAVAAAIPGYVAEARARAGDIVKEGDVLAQLDDRDLRLERVKWASQRAQRSEEYRAAMAGHERARIRVLEAQIAQADAQLALIDEQLSRTRLRAPFDAVIVKGDLSQSLGAPVERGNVLFELAPLDTYRVILKVDERDITNVKTGQAGQLTLSSMPHERMPMAIEKITPVSVVEEGRNYFRVEAVVKGGTEKLRPGMEGVGKIEVDERKLLWIWTYKIVHWVRMWFWSWWP
jgi:RND family efflux transporter MFP subunit